MPEYLLSKQITERSVATTWDEAKLEWDIHRLYNADSPQTCLCGHSPIKKICVIRNRENGKLAEVGNCCAKKFDYCSTFYCSTLCRTAALHPDRPIFSVLSVLSVVKKIPAPNTPKPQIPALCAWARQQYASSRPPLSQPHAQ
jgi:hypothetical protein